MVDLAMSLAARGEVSGLRSPHLHGGDDLAKLLYEYEGPDALWTALHPHASMSDLAGRRVLDIGCGWGGKTLRYAQTGNVEQIVGMDLPDVYNPEVPRAYAAQCGIRNCRFVQGSAERLPFDDCDFDVAIMDDVLEHVADPGQALRECARVLRPRGRLLAKFPSIRMMRAHHLDRALSFPALHWVLSLRTWAAGLNDYRVRHPRLSTYEPFDRVVRSRFDGRWLTCNLNGLDLRSFRTIVEESRFQVRHLGVEVTPPTRFGFGRPAVRAAFDRLSSWPGLEERLGSSVVFVGERESL